MRLLLQLKALDTFCISLLVMVSALMHCVCCVDFVQQKMCACWAWYVTRPLLGSKVGGGVKAGLVKWPGNGQTVDELWGQCISILYTGFCAAFVIFQSPGVSMQLLQLLCCIKDSVQGVRSTARQS